MSKNKKEILEQKHITKHKDIDISSISMVDQLDETRTAEKKPSINESDPVYVFWVMKSGLGSETLNLVW